MRVENKYTAGLGFLLVGLGAVYLLICPPVLLLMASSWNHFTDQELSSKLINLFKSIPGVLSPILYISGPL